MALMTRKNASLAEAFFNGSSRRTPRSRWMKLAAMDPEQVLRFAAMDPAIAPEQKSLWDDLVRYAQKELQAREKGL